MGRVDVDAMLRSLTWQQLVEWELFTRLEGGFEEDRADYRAASIASMIANTNRDPKKHPAPWPMTDFLVQFGDAQPASATRPQQDWRMMKAIGQAMAEGSRDRGKR